MKRKIVLVEDDPWQAQLFKDELEAARGQFEIEVFLSEAEFVKWWEEKGLEFGADYYVFDLMLRWTRPGVLPGAENDDRSDFAPDRAGIRCKDMVLAKQPDAKVVIWTVTRVGELRNKEKSGAIIVLKDQEVDSRADQLFKQFSVN